jgi:hypothetical protein
LTNAHDSDSEKKGERRGGEEDVFAASVHTGDLNVKLEPDVRE